MFSFSFNCDHQSSFKVTPHSLQGSRVDFFNHRFYPLSELCQIFWHWGDVYLCFDEAPKVKVKWRKVWWPRWPVDQGGVFIRSAADQFIGQTLVQEVPGNKGPVRGRAVLLEDAAPGHLWQQPAPQQGNVLLKLNLSTMKNTLFVFFSYVFSDNLKSLHSCRIVHFLAFLSFEVFFLNSHKTQSFCPTCFIFWHTKCQSFVIQWCKSHAYTMITFCAITLQSIAAKDGTPPLQIWIWSG